MPSFQCRYSTCNALINHRGYCDKHQKHAQPDHDAESKRFYDSASWKKARRQKLHSNPVCERCDNALAFTVHHVRPVIEVRDSEPEMLTAASNLMSICTDCHNAIHKGGRGASKA